MKDYIKYIKGNWGATLIAPILMVLDVLGGLIQPYYMSKIIDIGIANNDKTYILKTGGIMIAFAFLTLISGFLCMYFSAKASYGFAANLREAMMNRIQEFSFSNINKFKTSSLIVRLTNDVQVISGLFQMILRIVIRAPFMFIGGLIMALLLSKKLSLILIILIPIVFLLVFILLKILSPYFLKVQQSIDKVNQVIKENLEGIKVIKSFVREDYEKNKFDKANNELKDMSIKSYSKVVILFPLLNTLLYIAIALIIWLGAKQAMLGQIEIGTLTSFIIYIVMTLTSLVMMSIVFVNFARAKVSSDRILEVLHEDLDIKDNQESTYEVTKGKVEYNIKKFSFLDSSDETILKNIKFTVNPGDIVAFIGSTGSGKSTLVNLIPRFYDVTDGYVKVDDIDVKDYNLKKLRDGIGVVLQENKLFKGTIKSNIKWGDESASDEEIIKVCQTAQIHDFISSMSKQYNSKVEQNGSNFSGGQKQRLCIARALIKKPKILILDDSVSALDASTEKNLTKALKNNFKNTTVFIIAQRISSCKNADYIFVVDNGTIVAKGNHKELLKSCKVYKEINDSQLEVIADAQ